ncbi:unnamed protein product [Adineta steineri]|uniref:MATH domain-containing protein n=2 Tax=Adineta steineri TaxID=433720 RepID=A0A818VPY9_9BILA|nr:unnamed protein product [Adineta steineri]
MQLICCGERVCESCSKSKLKQLSQCPFCLEPGTPETRQDKGNKREVDSLKVNCPRCNDQCFGLFMNLPEHLSIHCDLACENCDEKFVFPQQREQHQQETCKNRIVSCPLDFLGCSQKVRFSHLSQHYISNEHQSYLFLFIKNVVLQSSASRANLALQKSFSEPYRRILTDNLGKIKSLIQDIGRTIENCVHLNLERQTKQAMLDGIYAQFGEIKKSSDNNIKLIESLHGMLMDMSKLLEEIRLKSFNRPKLLTSDNTFIWSINFLTLRNSGQPMQSEPVHTSQSGYRLCLGCDITTDERNEKHVSISFTILLGEFDAILSWPVPFSITLSILDLTLAKKHITCSIPTKSKALTFQRPISSANPPFRVEKICPVDTLSKTGSNYVQDGFMFIEACIDFTANSRHEIPDDGVKKTAYDPMKTDVPFNMMVD